MSHRTPNYLATVPALLQRLGSRRVAQSTAVWLVLIAVLLAAIACGNEPPTASTPEPTISLPKPVTFFPRQKAMEGEKESMTALLHGELVVVKGCLRVHDELLIWPHDFRLSTEKDVVQILNGAGEVVASVGDHIYCGGGEVPATWVSSCCEQPLPDECPGPYWIVGDVIRQIEATE